MLLLGLPPAAVAAPTTTPEEFGFLVVLARYSGRVVTHRMILQEVWGPEFGTETQYLRVYASQLRKKLDNDPAATPPLPRWASGFATGAYTTDDSGRTIILTSRRGRPRRGSRTMPSVLVLLMASIAAAATCVALKKALGLPPLFC